MATLSELAREVEQAIDDGLASESKRTPRQYIGGSSVGNDCDAYISLTLRGYPDNAIDPQLMRIFEMGHILEVEIVRLMKYAPMITELHEINPVTNEQWEFKSHGGHHVSHLDGIAEMLGLGTIVFEAKSMNEAKFNAFKSHGVQVSHPMYYYQVQDYMDLSQLGYAMIVAYCKNNSKLGVELVEFNPVKVGFIRARIEEVIEHGGERIAYDEIDWRCKSCFKRDACWGYVQPEVSCVSCKFATPDLSRDDKSWHCTKYNKHCDYPCGDYKAYTPMERIL